MDLSRLNRRRREHAGDHLYFFTGVDNQCVRFWFKDIEMVAKMIQADESVCLKQAVGLLIFEAERWYQEHQHMLMTWSDFKQHMIARFDINSHPTKAPEPLLVDTLSAAHPSTILWHPQHIADFRSYQEKKLHNTDRLLPLPVCPSLLSISDTFEDVWPDGDESWNDNTPQPQRLIFITNQSPVLVPPQSETEHDQSRTNAPDTERELFVEFAPDRCELINNFAMDFPYGETSANITEAEAQEPKHPTELRVYQHTSESKPIKKHLYTFSRTRGIEISSHVLKSKYRRSHSKYTPPFRVSWRSQSPRSLYCRSPRFLKSVTTHLTSWWLIIFTILFGTQLALCLHDNLHCSKTSFAKITCIFSILPLLLASRTITLNTPVPFVKTLEILRNLETLLIYGIA